MKTLILAGGFGTRIRDVADNIPKPMIPIGDYPILWHIMKLYAHYSHQDFILCLGYKSDIIKNYFLNYHHHKSDFTLNLKNNKVISLENFEPEDWRITFCETGLNAQTGARIHRAQKHLENEDFFAITYGDGVANIDINALIDFHQSHGKLMTVTASHPPGRFGELQIKDNRVIGFNERPQVSEGWISAGFFICSRDVLGYLSDKESLIFERDPMNALVKDEQLMVYKHHGFWHPMDTSREHQLLNKLWDDDKAPWRVW